MESLCRTTSHVWIYCWFFILTFCINTMDLKVTFFTATTTNMFNESFSQLEIQIWIVNDKNLGAHHSLIPADLTAGGASLLLWDSVYTAGCLWWLSGSRLICPPTGCWLCFGYFVLFVCLFASSECFQVLSLENTVHDNSIQKKTLCIFFYHNSGFYVAYQHNLKKNKLVYSLNSGWLHLVVMSS